MEPKDFSLLAAAIFAVVALLHLIRAVGQWPVVIDTASIPVWVSWVACVVTGALAAIGFAAARN